MEFRYGFVGVVVVVWIVLWSGCVGEEGEVATTSTITTTSTTTSIIQATTTIQIKFDAELCLGDDFLCKALATKDMSFCNNASEYVKPSCISMFSENISDCIALKDTYVCRAGKAILSDNLSLCELIKDFESLRDFCYCRILWLSGDVSLCSEHGLGCYGVSDIAVKAQDPSLCNETSEKFRRECYERVYLETEIDQITKAFCDKIGEIDIQETCHRLVNYKESVPGFNESYCEKDNDCGFPSVCSPVKCINKVFSIAREMILCLSVCGPCCLNNCECKCINNTCTLIVIPR